MGVSATWFKERIGDLGMSQRQFAKKLGIDPSSLTLVLQGRRGVGASEAALMARLFGVDVAEVMIALGVRVESSPRADYARIRGIVGPDMRVSWAKGSKDFGKVRLKGHRKGVEAVRVDVAGSAYAGLDGALVLYRPRPGVDPEAVGRAGIVVRGEGAVFGALRKGHGPGKWTVTDLGGQVLERDVTIDAAWAAIEMIF